MISVNSFAGVIRSKRLIFSSPIFLSLHFKFVAVYEKDVSDFLKPLALALFKMVQQESEDK